MLVHLTAKKSVDVASYEEASDAIEAHWFRRGRGASSFYRDALAGVIEENGVPTAHVSYNGRVWRGADRFTLNAHAPLFDPGSTGLAPIARFAGA